MGKLDDALRMSSQPVRAGDRMAECESVLMRELIAMVVDGRLEACDVTHAHQEKFIDSIKRMDEWEFISKVAYELCECSAASATAAYGMSDEVWHACEGDYDLLDASAAHVWDAVLVMRNAEWAAYVEAIFSD
jgi:hypothetical protein